MGQAQTDQYPTDRHPADQHPTKAEANGKSSVSRTVVSTGTVSIGSVDELDEASTNLRKVLDAASGSGLVVKHSGKTSRDESGKFENQRGGTNTPPATRCMAPDIFSFPDTVKINRAESPTDGHVSPQVTGYDRITELGQDFIGEGGFYSQSVGIALGQAFLAHGLGEEARAIALLLRGDEADLLAEMGDVVADIALPQNASLRGAGACFEADMPWRIMATVKAQPGKALGLVPAYLPQLEDLPAFLAFNFSTRLAIHAAEQKNYDLAEQLLDVAKNYPYFSSPRLRYADAFLGAQKGNLQGISGLVSLAREEGEMQAKALFALGDIEDLGKISNYDEYITDVEAVSEKYSEGDKSGLALFYEIRALATTGRFLTAIEKLSGAEGLSPAIKNDALSVIGSQLMMALLDEDDVRRLPALSAYLKHTDIFNLNTDQQTNLLKESIQLGHALALPNLSLRLVQKLPIEQRSIQEIYINTWAHMESGNPKRAFDEARPYIEHIEFLEIAAKALLELGLEEEAISLFARLPADPQRDQLKARLAWASNAWELAADSYDKILESPYNPDTTPIDTGSIDAGRIDTGLKRNASAYMAEMEFEPDETGDTDVFARPFVPARSKSQIEGLIEQSRKEINAIEDIINRG